MKPDSLGDKALTPDGAVGVVVRWVPASEAKGIIGLAEVLFPDGVSGFYFLHQLLDPRERKEKP